MKQPLLLLAKLTVSIGLLSLIANKIDLQKLTVLLAASRTIYILAAFGGIILGLLLSSFRWHLLVLSKAHSRIGFGAILDLYLVGLFFNSLLPGGIAGDMARVHHLQRHPLTVGDVFGSVVVDRVLGVLGLILISTSGALLCQTTLLQLEFPIHLVYLFTVGVIICAAILRIPLERWVERLPTTNPMVAKCISIYISVRDYLRTKAFWTGLGISLVVAILWVGTMFFLARSFDISVPPAYLIWMVPTVAILSTLPVSFSGWGIREVGYIYFLKQVGVPTEKALTISIVFGGLVLLTNLIGGIWYLLRTILARLKGVSATL